VAIGNIYSLNNSLLSPLSHCWTFGMREWTVDMLKKFERLSRKEEFCYELIGALQCVTKKFIEHFDGFCKKWRQQCI
jgi:hypothetical protein